VAESYTPYLPADESTESTDRQIVRNRHPNG
jgi:hypothetical protein